MEISNRIDDLINFLNIIGLEPLFIRLSNDNYVKFNEECAGVEKSENGTITKITHYKGIEISDLSYMAPYEHVFGEGYICADNADLEERRCFLLDGSFSEVLGDKK